MDGSLRRDRKQVRDTAYVVMMPVCEQRLLDRDVFGRKDGFQRCEPGGFRVAGVDEKAGGAGADDVSVCTLEREL